MQLNSRRQLLNHFQMGEKREITTSCSFVLEIVAILSLCTFITCRNFKSFTSPASGPFSWVGAEKIENIFLNDLRWNERLMPWCGFLNLLKGLSFHLHAPKTHYAEDILLSKRPHFLILQVTVRKEV